MSGEEIKEEQAGANRGDVPPGAAEGEFHIIWEMMMRRHRAAKQKLKTCEEHSKLLWIGRSQAFLDAATMIIELEKP